MFFGLLIALEIPRTHQDTFQSSEPEIVVRLAAQLIFTEIKETDNLPGQFFSSLIPLTEQGYLGNQLAIWLDHRQGSEQLFQIFREVGTASIPRVHGDKDT